MPLEAIVPAPYSQDLRAACDRLYGAGRQRTGGGDAV